MWRTASDSEGARGVSAKKLIITDGVFSMDEILRRCELCELAEKHGLHHDGDDRTRAACGRAAGRWIITNATGGAYPGGTLSKAIRSMGGMYAVRDLIDFLYCVRGRFVFDFASTATARLHGVCAAGFARREKRVKKLWANTKLFSGN